MVKQWQVFHERSSLKLQHDHDPHPETTEKKLIASRCNM